MTNKKTAKTEPVKDWLQVMEDMIAREKLREQSEKERESSNDEDDRQKSK